MTPHHRRDTAPWARVRLGPLLVAALTLTGCPKQVPVPEAANDSPPTIFLYANPIQGTVTPADPITSSQPAQVSLGARVQFTVKATNPGGVKTLDLIFNYGLTTISVSTSANLDAAGQGPDQLSILGTDGAGHPGNTPIIMDESPASFAVPTPAGVTVTATNFNDQKTSYVVIYSPHWWAPKVMSFKAKPTYMDLGSSSTLSWAIQECHAYCEVKVEGRDGVDFSTLVESHGNLAAYGSLPVSPTRSTLTEYTLTAWNPNGSVGTPIKLQVEIHSEASQPGQVYYLKMTGNSGVTPCFTMALLAPDETTAIARAESENGGFEAEVIPAADYLTACD